MAQVMRWVWTTCGEPSGEKGKSVNSSAENGEDGPVVGRYCRLLKPVRDREGHSRFDERPRILREVRNLDRVMYLVQFGDGNTTFVFPHEIIVD
jgi:hypothetical protein